MKKLLLSLIKIFRNINIYESKKNLSRLSFNNLELKEYNSIDRIRSKKIRDFLKIRNLLDRFSKGNSLYVLKKGLNFIGFGWKNSNSNHWYISEIDKYFYFKNKIILFDFWISKNFRNKGYYVKMLSLIKNKNTKKKFVIYSLSTNKESITGILNAGFKLKKILSKFND